MTCVMRDVELYRTLGEDKYKTTVTITDFRDGTWTIKLGEFGCETTLRLDDASVEALFIAIGDMLHDHDVWEAVSSGDMEMNPKEDERNTEAWLDVEG